MSYSMKEWKAVMFNSVKSTVYDVLIRIDVGIKTGENIEAMRMAEKIASTSVYLAVEGYIKNCLSSPCTECEYFCGDAISGYCRPSMPNWSERAEKLVQSPTRKVYCEAFLQKKREIPE